VSSNAKSAIALAIWTVALLCGINHTLHCVLTQIIFDEGLPIVLRGFSLRKAIETTHLATANEMIERMGYHRRDKEAAVTEPRAVATEIMALLRPKFGVRVWTIDSLRIKLSLYPARYRSRFCNTLPDGYCPVCRLAPSAWVIIGNQYA
jgi:hypothetical protein